uniref:Uncharacterized protein n=1 Tax=Oryza punctata TaxID=4537 RepID=A0A0E0LTF7_ORYPU
MEVMGNLAGWRFEARMHKPTFDDNLRLFQPPQRPSRHSSERTPSTAGSYHGEETIAADPTPLAPEGNKGIENYGRGTKPWHPR